MEKLSKVKDYLLELAFLALLIRIVAVGCGVGEALAVVSLVVSMAYNKWLTKDKLTEREALEARWEVAFKELNDKLETTSNKVSSLTVNQSVRKTTHEPQAHNPLRPDGTAKRYF